MLYKKNTADTLSEKLFENPTSEYRATPFWAWNGVLEKGQLLREIEYMKQMGFGGFHMVRVFITDLRKKTESRTYIQARRCIQGRYLSLENIMQSY